MSESGEGGGEPRVERLALEFIRYCDAIERRIPALHAALYEHLADAAASVLANIGEAWDEPSPGDKARFFRYALRSAGECERMLKGLRAVNALNPTTFHAGMGLLRDIKLDLRRLIHWARSQ